MKKYQILLFSFLAVGMIACSDDDDVTPNPEPASSTYFPLEAQNSWTFSNKYNPDNGQTTTSSETMKVESTSNSGADLSSDASEENEGLITGLFASGELMKSNGKLIYNGALNLDLGVVDTLTIALPLENVIVYDSTAQANTELFTVTDSTDIAVTFGQLGTFDLHFVYTLTTTEKEAMSSISVNGETYDQVISSNLNLTLSCEVQSNGVSLFTLIENQEVISSTNFYAENVGMVKSTNRIEVQFAEVPAGIPGVPELNDIMANTSQKLNTHSVQ